MERSYVHLSSTKIGNGVDRYGHSTYAALGKPETALHATHALLNEIQLWFKVFSSDEMSLDFQGRSPWKNYILAENRLDHCSNGQQKSRIVFLMFCYAIMLKLSLQNFFLDCTTQFVSLHVPLGHVPKDPWNTQFTPVHGQSYSWHVSPTAWEPILLTELS
jgi:hypothetical protein